MGDDDRRDAALLTNSQRKFLIKGPSGENPAHDRAMESRIRKRVRDGILDFRILLEHLPDDERERILDQDREPEPTLDGEEPARLQKEQIEMKYSVRWGVAFLYLLDPDGFERAVEDAIDAWFKKRDEVGEATVTIEKEMTETVDEYPGAEFGASFGVLEAPGGLIPQHLETLRETGAEILAPTFNRMSEETRRTLLKALQDSLPDEGKETEE